MRIKFIKESTHHKVGDICDITISYPGYEGKLVTIDSNNNPFLITELNYNFFQFIENKKKEVLPIP